MSLRDEYNSFQTQGGAIGSSGVTFITKQGSGKKATLSSQSSGGLRDSYNQIFTPEVIKQNQMVQRLQNYESLPTIKEKYDVLREAKNAGIITQKQHTDEIIRLGSNEQSRIKQDFQSSLNPIEQFVGGTISTAQRVGNTADMFATGLGGALATALQNNTVGKNAANAESMKRIKDIANRETITGDRGVWYDPTQKADIGEFIKSIASTAGEVAPWVLPYGAMSKFAGRVTAPLAERAIASTAGKAISKVIPGAASKLIAGATKIPLNAAINAPAFGLSNALTQYGTTGKVDPLQVAQQAAIGGVMVAGGEFIGDIIRKGPVPQLEKLKADRLKVADNLMPELTQAQADKFGPQKIGVSGGDTTGTKIGVKTPQIMSDVTYTKEFNKISKSYDVATKKLEGMLPAKQKIMSNAIDARYTEQLNTLDNAYNNPQMTVKGQPKVTNQPTTTLETQLNKTVTPKLETSAPQVSKTVDTPKLAEVPVVGEQKVTGSALKVEAKAVEKGLTEKFPDKATFGTTSYADDAVKAVEIAHNNPTQGWDILSGKTNSTPSMRSSVFEAMSKRMTKEGDVVGLQRLAKSKYNTNLSESAQLLGAKGYNADPYSAVDAISQVSKDKIVGLERRTNIRVDAVKQEAGSIVAKATKIPTKKDWSSFIESIKC